MLAGGDFILQQALRKSGLSASPDDWPTRPLNSKGPGHHAGRQALPEMSGR